MKATTKVLLGVLVCAAMVVAFQGMAYALSAASFTFSGDHKVASPGNPVNVSFTDTSRGATSWQWNFNDGSANSTVKSPYHNFAWANNYTVTLTANDGNGPASVQHEVNVLLKVNGSVSYPYNFSIAELYGNCSLNTSVQVPYHKHNDTTTYWFNGTGLSLNDLLNHVSPSVTATNVTFIGADGFTRTIPLSTIRSDPNAILFFDVQSSANGSYVWLRNIITTDYYAQNWVSELDSITVS